VISTSAGIPWLRCNRRSRHERAEPPRLKDPLATALARQCLAAVEVMPVLDGDAFESRLGRALGETPTAQALMRSFLQRRGD